VTSVWNGDVFPTTPFGPEEGQSIVGLVVLRIGALVGDDVGVWDGREVGEPLGGTVGVHEGFVDGVAVGDNDGFADGRMLCQPLGTSVGLPDGRDDGKIL